MQDLREIVDLVGNEIHHVFKGKASAGLRSVSKDISVESVWAICQCLALILSEVQAREDRRVLTRRL